MYIFYILKSTVRSVLNCSARLGYCFSWYREMKQFHITKNGMITRGMLKVSTKSDHVRAATNESQNTLNKCETRNKTVFHTRLCHPETINSVPLNSVLRIKQIGV